MMKAYFLLVLHMLIPANGGIMESWEMRGGSA